METATSASAEISTRLDAARTALAGLAVAPAVLDAAIQAAAEVDALTQDEDLAVATAVHWARLAGLVIESAALEARLGASVARLAEQLEQLGVLHLPADW